VAQVVGITESLPNDAGLGSGKRLFSMLARSYMIGDRETDIAFAPAAGYAPDPYQQSPQTEYSCTSGFCASDWCSILQQLCATF
jgi:histidinol phosphatase-like enzyme